MNTLETFFITAEFNRRPYFETSNYIQQLDYHNNMELPGSRVQRSTASVEVRSQLDFSTIDRIENMHELFYVNE